MPINFIRFVQDNEIAKLCTAFLNFYKTSYKLFETSGTSATGGRKARSNTTHRIFQDASWNPTLFPRTRKKTRKTLS